MFIEDWRGDLVHLKHKTRIICFDGVVELDLNDEKSNIVLFEDSAKKAELYMSELKKELAAFGKLIQVKMD